MPLGVRYAGIACQSQFASGFGKRVGVDHLYLAADVLTVAVLGLATVADDRGVRTFGILPVHITVNCVLPGVGVTQLRLNEHLVSGVDSVLQFESQVGVPCVGERSRCFVLQVVAALGVGIFLRQGLGVVGRVRQLSVAAEQQSRHVAAEVDVRIHADVFRPGYALVVGAPAASPASHTDLVGVVGIADDRALAVLRQDVHKQPCGVAEIVLKEVLRSVGSRSPESRVAVVEPLAIIRYEVGTQSAIEVAEQTLLAVFLESEVNHARAFIILESCQL